MKKTDSLNSHLITRKEIKNSPFTIIGTNGDFFGTMGKYRLTEAHKSEKEVEEELSKMTWNRVTQVIMLLIEINATLKI